MYNTIEYVFYSCRSCEAQPTCSESMKTAVDTNAYCGYMADTDGPLAGCIKHADVQANMFAIACRMDVCAYQEDEAMARDAACKNLEALVETCEEKGHNITKWRRADFCRE